MFNKCEMMSFCLMLFYLALGFFGAKFIVEGDLTYFLLVAVAMLIVQVVFRRFND